MHAARDFELARSWKFKMNLDHASTNNVPSRGVNCSGTSMCGPKVAQTYPYDFTDGFSALWIFIKGCFFFSNFSRGSGVCQPFVSGYLLFANVVQSSNQKSIGRWQWISHLIFTCPVLVWVVVSSMNFIFQYFPFHLWDVILPIDELIFFRGIGQPPTSSFLAVFPASHVGWHCCG